MKTMAASVNDVRRMQQERRFHNTSILQQVEKHDYKKRLIWAAVHVLSEKHK